MRSKLVLLVLFLVVVIGLVVLMSGRKEKSSTTVPPVISNTPAVNVPTAGGGAKKEEAKTQEGDVISLDEGNFNEFINSDLPVIVDFWQTGCGACMMLEPIFKEVAGEMKGKMKFAMCQIDYNGNEKFAYKYHIEATPTMIVFKKGKEIGRIIGYREKDSLMDALKDFLRK
ncbi:thioredoxin family protein [bacterium]|nr:thioredoxin family protein [bacterium]